MRKFKIVGLALFAVFAFSAYAASTAFAVETASWLINGLPILLGESYNVDILPEAAPNNFILVEDMGAPGTPDILCEVQNALGWLFANGEDLQTEGECNNAVEDAAGNTCRAPITVLPVHLPWLTQLEEVVAVFEDGLTSGTGGAPGWEVTCLDFLGILHTDTCTTNLGKANPLENLADGLILATFEVNPPVASQANCTTGGNTQGLVEGELLLHVLNASGLLLSASVSLAPEQP
jgi:hypothetical protein